METKTQPSVRVVTSSRTAAAIQQSLAQRLHIAADLHPGTELRDVTLAIAALDCWNAAMLMQWQECCRKTRTRLLCVHIHGSEAIIGPVVDPIKAGCIQCWFSRFYSSRPLGRKFVDQCALSEHNDLPSPWLSFATVRVIAELTADRVLKTLHGGCDEATCTGIPFYCWDMATCAGQRATFLPEPLCPACANIEMDSAERACVSLKSRRKHSPHSDRLRDIRSYSRPIQAACLGERSGVVREVANSNRIRHGAVAFAATPIADGAMVERCSGFSNDYASARTVAIIEALERYSSSLIRSRKIAVRDSRNSLGETAFDPESFGLHSAREYAANPDILTPYTPSLKMNFVWAYSFRRRSSALLPYQLGFYPYFVTDDPVFAIEGSTGCATGSCAEEAILHGIFEVVERDAFLLTWYARRRRCEFDPLQTNDPEIRCRCHALNDAGFQVLALDITTDYGIPSLWLMAYRESSGFPFAFCTGSAHTRPLAALKKALRELTATVAGYTAELQDHETAKRAWWLSEDPSRVRTMRDHALFYCSPGSACFLEFLRSSRGRTSLQAMEEEFADLQKFEDMRDELVAVIQRILKTGADVVCVEQTSPEQRNLDLATYKVLVPGAIPMTWGEHLRRLKGLPRLDAALQSDSAMFHSEPSANPAPHPFP